MPIWLFEGEWDMSPCVTCDDGRDTTQPCTDALTANVARVMQSAKYFLGNRLSSLLWISKAQCSVVL